MSLGLVLRRGRRSAELLGLPKYLCNVVIYQFLAEQRLGIVSTMQAASIWKKKFGSKGMVGIRKFSVALTS